MINFFRKIRKKLADDNKPIKYMRYAIGEIVLVVIGILIALQINNWNEDRKSKNGFQQTMLGLAEDIRNDTTIIQHYISVLQTQEKAAQLIIPILENRETIVDSMAFFSAFLGMSFALNMDLNMEIWDELRKSGLPKVYADPQLVSKIQNYYHKYKGAARNWEDESQPRIEIRGLKYDLMDQTDLNKMRLADGTNLPSQKAIKAIFNEKRVVSLIKRIDFTSTYFINIFMGCKVRAIEVLELIDGQYGTNKEEPL
ncbi:MAG: DUF6090 family protein [Maribacter sp.]|nr:DUF6090 family protein [Maribacter sp.]